MQSPTQKSRRRPVTSRAAQRSMHAPVLSNIFIHDLDDGIECTLRKCTGTKLESVVIHQMNVLSFRWMTTGWKNGLTRTSKFNEETSKTLHLWRNNATHHYVLGSEELESNFAEKNLEIEMANSLAVSQYALAAKKANSTLNGIRKMVDSRSKEEILTLNSVLVRPHTPGVVSIYGLGIEGQQRATKMINRLQYLTYEERLRELGMFSLQGDLTDAHKYLMGRCK